MRFSKPGFILALFLVVGWTSAQVIRSGDGTTALHWAVQSNDLKEVRSLLAAGAKVRTANRYGITPLHLAATNGSAPMIELLLNAGADPNALSAKGVTVIMEAARAGDPTALKLLLAKGANPNIAEPTYGETALMWAAAMDRGDAIRVLVEGGANPNTHSEVINLPNAKVDFSFAVATALPKGGMTAAMYAARQGQINAVTALAEVGANLDEQDPEGCTALVIAIINAHYDVAARLAEKGANSNVGDNSGMTALYAAVDMAHLPGYVNRPSPKPSGKLSALDLTSVLLKHGADPNLTLKAPTLMRQHATGDTALAAGATPLMRAAKAGDLELMKILVDGGADPSRALANGTNALSLTMGGRGARILTTDVPMFQAVKLLLDKGANVNTVGANGQTILHQSIDRGPAFVKMLIEHGAKLDIKDGTGRTPLDIATGVAPTVTAAPAGGRGARGAPPAGPGGPGGPGGAGSAAPVDPATIALLKGQ